VFSGIHRGWRRRRGWWSCLSLAASVGAGAESHAQQTRAPVAHLSGRVTELRTGGAMPDVTISIEGTALATLTDSTGSYRLANVPAGPQVLRAQRLGYSPTRLNLMVPSAGSMTQDVEIARHAVQLSQVQVSADPMGRARGELGTATVIAEEAIRNQMAASLAGVLELVPGVTLRPPGVDNVQQISLRSVPVSGGAFTGDPSAENLAAFGTLIVLDGVPLSNNSNMQSLGPRAELAFSSSFGGGVDLRRIPAQTLERVEVIRGVPSARWGDLSHGAVIVDTRAGAIEPALAVRMDASTTEMSLVGGHQLGGRNTVTATSNLARTRVGGGTRADRATRLAGQLAHRFAVGGSSAGGPDDVTADERLRLDTRIDFYRLADDRPETEPIPGSESFSHEHAFRILERLRLRLHGESRLEWTTAYERGRQRSMSRGNFVRGAMPLTDRLEPGRQVGRFVGGIYNARVTVDGDPAFLYSRAELSAPASFAGFGHALVFGSEIRRERNNGEGVQFDMEFPPSARFNGVRGFDRPRSFADIPALATTAFYASDRISRTIGSGALLNLQIGARLDVLHEAGRFSAVRDAAPQPRATAELAPARWLRLRAGAGRHAKSPSLAQLHPALNYYDVINVNYFANEPAERLAVLTTFVIDPTNPTLGYSVSDRAEGGVEITIGRAALGFTLFSDRLRGGVGVRPEAAHVLREHFELADAIPGSGSPPQIIEPAASVDSVPVLIDRPANNLTQRGRGFEITADLPEIAPLRTRFVFQGALVKSRVHKEGLEFAGDFPVFQISQNLPRSPYYESVQRTGKRFLFNTRIIHHQPELGLVITGTIQHTLREVVHNVGATDTLAFVGYMTRGGSLVPVAAEDRVLPEYADLRRQRVGILTDRQTGAVDWLFSLQVSKTLPRDGRLSFYAYNALDRQGHFGSPTVTRRVYPATRFGLEVTIPVEALLLWR
jgi:hypothetical protein